MASFREIVQILITADSKQAVAAIKGVGDTAERDLKKASAGSKNFGDTMLKTGAIAVGAGAAIAVGLASTIRSAQESEQAQIKLQNTIKNSPQLVGASVKAFNDQASALQNVTVASDEQVTSAQAMLGTFHLTQDEILKLTPLIVDYARKFDTDLVSAAKQVGKAMDGQIGALQRNGILIDKNAFATDRFNTVLHALRENAGGFAKAEGKTFDGQMQILSNHIDDMKESIGRGALSILNDLLPALNTAATSFGQLDESTGNSIGQIATIASICAIASGGLLLLAGVTAKAKAAFAEGGIAAGRFGTAIKGISAAGAITGGILLLVDALDKIEGVSENAADGIKDVINATSDAKALKSFNNEVERLADLKKPTGLLDLIGVGGDLFDEFDKGDIKIQQFNKILSESPGAAQRLVNAMKRNGEETGNFQKKIDEANKAQKRSAEIAGEQAGSQDKAATSAERAAASQEGLADAFKKLTDEQDKAAQKTQTYLDSVRSLYDANFGLQDSLSSLQETFKDGSSSLQDRQKAILDVAAAAQTLAIQQAGPSASAAEKANLSLFSQVAALNSLKDAYPEMTGFIDGYIGKLGEQNAASKSSASSFDTAITALQALGSEYPKLQGPIDALIKKIQTLKTANSDTSVETAITALRALGSQYRQLGPDIDALIKKLQDPGLTESKTVDFKATGIAPLSSDAERVAKNLKLIPHDVETIFSSKRAPEVSSDAERVAKNLGLIPHDTETVFATKDGPKTLDEIAGVHKAASQKVPRVVVGVSAPGSKTSRVDLDGVTRSARLIPGERHTTVTAPGARESKREIDDHNQSAREVPSSKSTAMFAPGAVQSKQQIDAHNQSANAVPPSKNTHISTTGVTDAIVGLNSLGQTISHLPSRKDILVSYRTEGVIRRALGGQVRAGKLTTVGEQGSELFVPNSVNIPPRPIGAPKDLKGKPVQLPPGQRSTASAIQAIGVKGEEQLVFPVDGRVIPHQDVARTLAKLGIDSRTFPKRALGGPVRSGQPYTVGEQGAELFLPDSIKQSTGRVSITVAPKITVNTGDGKKSAAGGWDGTGPHLFEDGSRRFEDGSWLRHDGVGGRHDAVLGSGRTATPSEQAVIENIKKIVAIDKAMADAVARRDHAALVMLDAMRKQVKEEGRLLAIFAQVQTLKVKLWNAAAKTDHAGQVKLLAQYNKDLAVVNAGGRAATAAVASIKPPQDLARKPEVGETASLTKTLVGVGARGGGETAAPITVHVNVTTADGTDAGKKIVEEIKRYEKRNGQGWRQ